MVKVPVMSWSPCRFRAVLEQTGLRHVDLARRTGVSASSIGSYASGVAAPTPAVLVMLAGGLEVVTAEIAPMSNRPTLHEYRWHAGHSMQSLAQAVGVRTGRVSTIMRGRAPLTDIPMWAQVLGISEDQVRQARRELPQRTDHYGVTGGQPQICRRAAAPAVIDNWETAVRKLSDSLDPALTARQQETLLYLSGELTVGHIAAQMGVSVATVRTHIQDVYTRLGPQVRSRATARAAVIAHLQPTPDPVVGLISRQLTTRQLDVMTRVNAGVRVPAIAAELGLSQATINRHLKMSLTRLGVRSQPEALVALFGGPTVG